jgi:hypothetical protein
MAVMTAFTPGKASGPGASASASMSSFSCPVSSWRLIADEHDRDDLRHRVVVELVHSISFFVGQCSSPYRLSCRRRPDSTIIVPQDRSYEQA